jgi:hypothetical protein
MIAPGLDDEAAAVVRVVASVGAQLELLEGVGEARRP